MRPRSLLLLFLIVAGLGAFVWFFERDLPSTDKRAELAKKVLPLQADAVIALSIERDGAVVRLERTSATDTAEWQVVEPLEARADEEEIASVLESLIALTKVRTLEDFEPQELGLDSPSLRVRLTTADAEWVLAVGDEVPATSNVITTVKGKTEAYVVSGEFREDLEKEPGEWRSRDVFPYDREVVTRVVLNGSGIGDADGDGDGDGDGVVLQRDGEDFRLEAPFRDEADDDKVSDLLDAVTGLEIDTFLDDPPPLSGLGLQPAVSVIHLEVGEGRNSEIRLGSLADDDEESRYALVDGRVIQIEAESGAELVDLASSPASDWQSRAWTKFDVFAIEKLRLREGESELVLERSSGDWLRNGEKIGYSVASDLLYGLGDAEVQGINVSTSVDLETPLLEIVLSTKDSEETLRLFPEAGGVYPAVREGRETVLELSRQSVDELRTKIAAARDAEPLPPASDEDGDAGE